MSDERQDILTNETHLLSEDLGCITKTPDNTKASCVGDSSCELWTSGHIHTLK